MTAPEKEGTDQSSKKFRDVADAAERLVREVSEVVVGGEKTMRMILTAMLCEGHVLLEGPPGIAKTLLTKTFANTLGGSFVRIQMTPDLLPSDITGGNVYNPKDGSFTLRRGPIFANVVMADELNRTNPKAQAALIEAMQERQVTIEGATIPLDRPFMVLATQIPCGSVGTYPLAEVQADRFAYRIGVDYPSIEDEIRIISRIDKIEEAKTKRVLSIEKTVALMDVAKTVHASERVTGYIVELVQRLRKREGVRLGPSPRGSIWIFKGARVRAMLEGRDFVIPDDIKAVAPYALCHRIVLEPELEAEDLTVSKLIQEALDETPVPKI